MLVVLQLQVMIELFLPLLNLPAPVVPLFASIMISSSLIKSPALISGSSGNWAAVG